MMLHLVRAALLIAVFAQAAPAADLPDPHLTPGVVRDSITAADLCPVAHTAKVRNVPNSEKAAIYAAYGIKNHTSYCAGREGCEVDHLISLELGGSNDRKNLWPEPYSGTVWNAHVKDRLENELHKLVCSGAITLKEAQRQISTDWIASYRMHLGTP